MALLYSQKLDLGTLAPGFKLTGTDERFYSLDDCQDKKGLLVVFSCNHCPYARAAWLLLVNLYKKFGDEVGFVAINPNNEVAYPEDSFEEMKKKKIEWGIPFPYLRDETQEVARAYQAQCTPDPYLFKNENGKFMLYYQGRINDNWQHPEQVKEKNLEEALGQLVSGDEAPEKQPPSMGCSIKWTNRNG